MFHCIPQMSVHEANTPSIQTKDNIVNHVEGGWPGTCKTHEDKTRVLRKIESNKHFVSSFKRLVGTLEKVIDANLTIDLYKKFFSEDGQDFSKEDLVVNTKYKFEDPSGLKRKVCKIAWHPENSRKVAVSYANDDFEANLHNNGPSSSYIWDMDHPNVPDVELKTDSPMMCCAFNPKNSHELIGGCYNGVVVVFDLRDPKNPQTSKPGASHTDPIYDISYIQSRNSEFVTVSTDGNMLWWDANNLAEPIDRLTLLAPNNEIPHAATCLEYRLDAGGTKYLVGTETGLVFKVERKAKKGEPSQITIKDIYGESSPHSTRVYSLQRNFATVKGFLTAGDWGCRMWTEEVKTSICGTDKESLVTCAKWSPSRFGLFFVCKADGSLDIWDYILRQDKPVWTKKIKENSSLTTITTDKKGRNIAVGDSQGTVMIMGLSNSLSIAGPTEKTDIQRLFEGEGIREKNLNQAIKAKLAAAGSVDKRQRAIESEKAEKAEHNEEILKRYLENLGETDKKYAKALEKFQPDEELAKMLHGDENEEEVEGIQDQNQSQPEQQSNIQPEKIEKVAEPVQNVEEPKVIEKVEEQDDNVEEVPEQADAVEEVSEQADAVEEVEAAEPETGV